MKKFEFFLLGLLSLGLLYFFVSNLLFEKEYPNWLKGIAFLVIVGLSLYYFIKERRRSSEDN